MIFASSVVVIFASTFLAQASNKREYHPWDGFQSGAWAKVKSEMFSPSGDRKFTERYEWTNNRVLHESEPSKNYTNLLADKAFDYRWIDEAKRTTEAPDRLSYAGKAIDCERQKYRIEEKGKEVAVVELWRSKEIKTPAYRLLGVGFVVPADVAKFKFVAPSQRTPLFELAVVDRKKVEVGGKTIDCLAVEGFGEERARGESKSERFTVRMLVTNEVPGHQLKHEASTIKDGKKLGRAFEIVDFHAPKAANVKKDD
jgi:hypothetical protein